MAKVRLRLGEAIEWVKELIYSVLDRLEYRVRP